MGKETGLEDRYEVIKKSNPNKKIDCIVMEFDDPIARVAIATWALALDQNGYHKLADDVRAKLTQTQKRYGMKKLAHELEREDVEQESEAG